MASESPETPNPETGTDGAAGPPEHPGGGNVPGSRRRRRGALPGAESGGSSTPPVGTPLDTPSPAAPTAEDGDLTVTEKQPVPMSKVWGLRVSEQHYDTGNTMVDVLATQFRLDKRQVGELIVQFLVARRFDLYEYVQQKRGPAPVDLDFFARQPVDLDTNAREG